MPGDGKGWRKVAIKTGMVTNTDFLRLMDLPITELCMIVDDVAEMRQ